EDLGLDLIGDILVKALFDDLAGRLAGAEPGDNRFPIGHELLDLLVHLRIDGRALDCHLDVFLARPDVLEFDRLRQLFGLLFFAVAGRSGLLGGGGGGFRRGFVGTRFVSHRMLPLEARKRLAASRQRARNRATSWLAAKQRERVMGLEPTTATLATWRSTTE